MPTPATLPAILTLLVGMLLSRRVVYPLADVIAAAQAVALGLVVDDVLFEDAGSGPLEDAHRAVGRVGHDLHFAIAIDVPGAGGLDVADFGDDVLLPLLARLARVLPPTQGVAPPAAGDEVHAAIAIDIHGDGGEVVVILALGPAGRDREALLEIGTLVPPGARDDVEDAIAIHIKNAGRLVTLIGDQNSGRL